MYDYKNVLGCKDNIGKGVGISYVRVKECLAHDCKDILGKSVRMS